jgi:RNA polymerase sigma-70 factor, ECF subfamily
LDKNVQHIIDGCKAYNTISQEALYNYCYASMFAVCERYTNSRDNAAILYNEAMLKVLTNIASYENKGAFMGWIRRTVVNTCIDNCRKNIKYNVLDLDEGYEEKFYVDSTIEDNISCEEIIKLIQALPKNTSLVFNLYAIEGYGFDEIATALNITKGTAKWHVSEARKNLREKLQSYKNILLKANG